MFEILITYTIMHFYYYTNAAIKTTSCMGHGPIYL